MREPDKESVDRKLWRPRIDCENEATKYPDTSTYFRLVILVNGVVPPGAKKKTGLAEVNGSNDAFVVENERGNEQDTERITAWRL